MIGFNNIATMGRLGNQMFQHASTKGIARKIGVQYCIPPANRPDFQIDNYGLFECFEMSNVDSVEFLNKQMKKHGPLPFTVLADPDFTYYKKYEIDRSMTKLMNAFIFKFPKALSAMLKGYIPIKLGGYLDIMTADFFLDKEGVVIRSKYSEKDAFDGFEFSEIKEFSLR